MGVAIVLDTSEVKALGRDIQRNAGKVKRKAGAAVRRGSKKVKRQAMLNAPVDTGDLKGSISAEVLGLTFEVGPEVYYGGYVEQGTTGPYPIPNAFGWGITVMHPGNRPRPYLGPAFDQELPGIVDEITDAGAGILGAS